MNAPVARILVPTVPPPQRHPLIFSTFDALAVGDVFEIVNDHDPSPLHRQFERTRPGLYSWQVLEAGPRQWQVRIGRVRVGMPAGETSGCGGAGGCGCS